MGNILKVIWRDQMVGDLRDAVPDMWYLDGTWISNSTQAAQEFDSLARGFDVRQVIDDPKKGTRVLLCDPETPDDSGADALVVSVYDDRLLVRRVIDKAAIAWLKSNVH